MSSLEQKETQVVTYEAFAPEDSTGTFGKQLDAYVWEHLPLDATQKCEFARLLRTADADGTRDVLSPASSDEIQ
jgi:hypothetical protein